MRLQAVRHPIMTPAAFVLHDIEGWKHEEIANELGMAVGSSKAQLHRARNLLRQYHKHNRIESAARERLGLPAAWADCEDYEAVDERLEAGSLAPALRLAIKALPREQRRALELRVVQQLEYEEVAGALGCSQNAARLRVSRALRSLGLKLRGAEA